MNLLHNITRPAANTLARFGAGLVTAGLVFGLGASVAAENLPEVSEEEAPKFASTSVEPVYGVDPRAQPSWMAVGARSTGDDAAGSSARAEALMQQAAGSEGFALSGSSTKADTLALQAGFTMGLMPFFAEKGKQKTYTAGLQLLEKLAGNESLDPGVKKQLTTAIAAAKEKKMSLKHVGTLTQATFQALANSEQGDKRLHTYLAVGLWSALTSYDMLDNGKIDGGESFRDLGKTLALVLIKDSKMEGSDQQLAARILAVNKELDKDKPNLKGIQKVLLSVLKVQADM
jgi:hypothetical protein